MAEAGSNAARILIAGIGNIFEGDDAFGVEVARLLALRPLPGNVQVEDFGIRSYDLAYALVAGYETVVLVDATSQGHLPGTLYLLELDPEEFIRLERGGIDPHGLNPVTVLQMAQTLGGITAKLYLVGCEPAAFMNDEPELGLSDPVREALPRALEMIEALIRDALGSNLKKDAGLEPAERK